MNVEEKVWERVRDRIWVWVGDRTEGRLWVRRQVRNPVMDRVRGRLLEEINFWKRTTEEINQ